MVIHDVKFDTKEYSIIQISSQELSMSSKYDLVLDTHLFMLGSLKIVYKSTFIYYGYP